MSRPNIFSYATKELSQDALICWLIAWSGVETQSAEDRALRDIGRAFVNTLLGKHGKRLTGDIKSVDIHQQDHNIDVLALVKDRKAAYVLLIEDKTHTDEHGSQLRDYFQTVVSGESRLGDVAGKTVCPVFLKTGNQPLARVEQIEEETVFKVLGRTEWLTVLNGYEGTNVILRDFRAHLQTLEDDSTSFGRWKKDEENSWMLAGWQGLFRHLEASRQLAGPNWNYVSQKKRGGGFWALHWCWRDIPRQAKAYLQLEVVPGRREASSRKLCFKVACWDNPDEDFRQETKRAWNELLQDFGGGRVTRPKRLGVGETMTVAVWSEPWMAFTAGRDLDIAGTLQNLKAAQCTLREAVSRFNMLDCASRRSWPDRAELVTCYQWGRLGFMVRGSRETSSEGAPTWTPGLFVGVLVNGWDHCTHLLDPEGGDACVILSVRQDLQPATKNPLYRTLLEDLRNKRFPDGWELYDHLNDERIRTERYGHHRGPNAWHPLHVRCPLASVLADARTAEEKADRFYTQAHNVVKMILEVPAMREPWARE